MKQQKPDKIFESFWLFTVEKSIQLSAQFHLLTLCSLLIDSSWPDPFVTTLFLLVLLDYTWLKQPRVFRRLWCDSTLLWQLYTLYTQLAMTQSFDQIHSRTINKNLNDVWILCECFFYDLHEEMEMTTKVTDDIEWICAGKKMKPCSKKQTFVTSNETQHSFSFGRLT